MSSIAENIIRIKRGLPEGVTLVAVSKYRPLEELQEAYDAGQRAFAESRPQEFAVKTTALPDDIQWHFIGHLQTNKLKFVLPWVALIHSVDSIHLLDAIQNWCAAASIKVNVLLEVHVAKEETKQGFSREEIFSKDWTELQNTQYKNVTICGIMGMASNTDDVDRVDADFEEIKDIFDCLKRQNPELKEFKELSMGMSHDWQIALRHSPTMVRIGSSIFIDK